MTAMPMHNFSFVLINTTGIMLLKITVVYFRKIHAFRPNSIVPYNFASFKICRYNFKYVFLSSWFRAL